MREFFFESCIWLESCKVQEGNRKEDGMGGVYIRCRNSDNNHTHREGRNRKVLSLISKN
jgi:hypothetical protein